MKLTKNCKAVLDAVIELEPNNNARFYTVDYVLSAKPELNMSRATFLGVLETLSEANAIKWGDRQHTGFALNEKGKEYKQIDRLEAKERWKERMIGFIVGILLWLVDVIWRCL